MKKLIKISILAVLVSMMCSCSIFKRTAKVEQHHHHYRDSTHTIEKLTVREIRTKGDSTRAFFNLDSLIRSGVLRSQDRFFTTEIRYLNGNLQVNTTIDSLTKIITDLERSVSKTEAIAMSAISNKTKTTEKKDYTGVVIALILFLVLLIIGVGLLLFYQMKNRMPLP